MRAVELIEKKRDKQVLSNAELEWLIMEFTAGRVPDYQMAALAMAIVLNGMTAEETTALTYAMARSGEMLDLSDVVDYAVDKHSTGGVGDKTSLVVAPLAAACGVVMAKMSGRGLGFSGGTLDKLEAFAGFTSSLTMDQFKQQIREIGVVVAGQTADLAPADGKLYALRDVTGTVPSLPLVASSIMSKKIAGGAQAMVLDVKWGNGAFMTTLESARALAELMVAIGAGMGRRVVCLLSDMNQPLGEAVGNSLEVIEAIETLKGRGPADFREHTLEVTDHLLVVAGVAGSLAEARVLSSAALDDGRALAKFRAWIAAQGGDTRAVDDYALFPAARLTEVVRAETDGYVQQMHARLIGQAAVRLGAGREKKGDVLDLGVGMTVHKKVGDAVQAGEALVTVYANDAGRLAEALELVKQAPVVGPQACDPLPMFYGVVR